MTGEALMVVRGVGRANVIETMRMFHQECSSFTQAIALKDLMRVLPRGKAKSHRWFVHKAEEGQVRMDASYTDYWEHLSEKGCIAPLLPAGIRVSKPRRGLRLPLDPGRGPQPRLETRLPVVRPSPQGPQRGRPYPQASGPGIRRSAASCRVPGSRAGQTPRATAPSRGPCTSPPGPSTKPARRPSRGASRPTLGSAGGSSPPRFL